MLTSLFPSRSRTSAVFGVTVTICITFDIISGVSSFTAVNVHNRNDGTGQGRDMGHTAPIDRRRTAPRAKLPLTRTLPCRVGVDVSDTASETALPLVVFLRCGVTRC